VVLFQSSWLHLGAPLAAACATFIGISALLVRSKQSTASAGPAGPRKSTK
jgi:hypothetical protein